MRKKSSNSSARVIKICRCNFALGKVSRKKVPENSPPRTRSKLLNLNQKFRKGVGGQRGLARRHPSYARDSGLFSAPFFLQKGPSWENGDTFLENFLGSFWGFVCCQPHPANPCSKPLTQAVLHGVPFTGAASLLDKERSFGVLQEGSGDLRWPGDSQHESGRFARIDSQTKPYFHNVRAIRANRLKPAISNSYPPPPPKRDSEKKGNRAIQFGNPETIRENHAIRANLRIASRESGHLSWRTVSRKMKQNCPAPFGAGPSALLFCIFLLMAFIGHIRRATRIPNAPSPELW